MLTRYIYKSQKVRKSVTQNAEQINWKWINKRYDELKNSMHVRGNIEIRVTESINSPITMGVIKPVIFLPKHMYDEKELNFMLAHELNHIKRKDMFLTIICYIILILNLYNPVAYYLLYEWKRVVELACDEKVMECMSEEERKKYGLLLVDMAEKEMLVQPTYSLGFGFARKKLITERVKNVMKKRQMNGFKRVVAGCLMMVVAFASSLSVFAYEPDMIWEVEELGNSETEVVFFTDEMFEEEMQKRTVIIDGEKITYKTEGYEKEFVYIDENGQIVVEECQEGTVSAKATCQHNYVSGTQIVHVKNSNNGCTLTYYTLVKCKICGYVKSKKVYDVEKHSVCTH